jgi:hypothetical protein
LRIAFRTRDTAHPRSPCFGEAGRAVATATTALFNSRYRGGVGRGGGFGRGLGVGVGLAVGVAVAVGVTVGVTVGVGVIVGVTVGVIVGVGVGVPPGRAKAYTLLSPAT